MTKGENMKFDPTMGETIYVIKMDEQCIRVEKMKLEPGFIGPVFRTWMEAQIAMEFIYAKFRENSAASDFSNLWMRNYAAGGVI